MPDFARAQITTTTADLSAYRGFLRKLAVGQVVTLPLDEGETSRQIMRRLNDAAQKGSVRLGRLPAEGHSVRFKVLPLEKRAIDLSPEAKQARTEKARATRAANLAATTTAEASPAGPAAAPATPPPEQEDAVPATSDTALSTASAPTPEQPAGAASAVADPPAQARRGRRRASATAPGA
jgi:hypothetical protein